MNKVLTKHMWPLESEEATLVKLTPKEKKPKQEDEDEVEEEEEVEEPKRKGTRKKGTSDEDEDVPERKGKQQKRGNSGFIAPLNLFDALAKFLGSGESELPRSEVLNRICNYIKDNSLQDPSDKRQISCDEKLKELFLVRLFSWLRRLKTLTCTSD